MGQASEVLHGPKGPKFGSPNLGPKFRAHRKPVGKPGLGLAWPGLGLAWLGLGFGVAWPGFGRGLAWLWHGLA